MVGACQLCGLQKTTNSHTPNNFRQLGKTVTMSNSKMAIEYLYDQTGCWQMGNGNTTGQIRPHAVTVHSRSTETIDCRAFCRILRTILIAYGYRALEINLFISFTLQSSDANRNNIDTMKNGMNFDSGIFSKLPRKKVKRAQLIKCERKSMRRNGICQFTVFFHAYYHFGNIMECTIVNMICGRMKCQHMLLLSKMNQIHGIPAIKYVFLMRCEYDIFRIYQHFFIGNKFFVGLLINYLALGLNSKKIDPIQIC